MTNFGPQRGDWLETLCVFVRSEQDQLWRWEINGPQGYLRVRAVSAKWGFNGKGAVIKNGPYRFAVKSIGIGKTDVKWIGVICILLFLSSFFKLLRKNNFIFLIMTVLKCIIKLENLFLVLDHLPLMYVLNFPAAAKGSLCLMSYVWQTLLINHYLLYSWVCIRVFLKQYC